MKKILLSTLVVVTFVFYVIYQRFGDQLLSIISSEDVNVRVMRPSSLVLPSNTPTTSNTPPGSFPATGSPTALPSTTLPTPSIVAGLYRNGAYTGPVTDAFYGNIQVQVVIQDGKIADVKFLDYPHDRNRSIQINSQAMPYLKAEAIQVQNANVDIVSGATQTSLAFRDSLASALVQAKN